jgi:hypothetical protein
MQFVCQFSSATVTNPGLNPVETNAKLRGYHRTVNPSRKTKWRPLRHRIGRRPEDQKPAPTA